MAFNYQLTETACPAPIPVRDDVFLDAINMVISGQMSQANEAKIDAGYRGGWGDGGASHIIEVAEYYMYGLHRQVPPAWQSEFNAAKKHIEHLHKVQDDPEYAQYCRLKNKFEGGE